MRWRGFRIIHLISGFSDTISEMESVLGRVVVMVAVGVVGGALAIMLVRAEAHARHHSSASKVVLEPTSDLSANLTRDISQCKFLLCSTTPII